MNKTQIIIIFVLIAIGILCRVVQFGQVPATLYVDEVAMYIDGASVASTSLDMHGNKWWQTIYPSYGDYKQAGYIWLVSAGMKLFGIHEWVVRLPSLLAGIGTILVAGALGYVLFEENKKSRVVIGLCSALVVAISPWSLLFSRVGFEGHLGQFFLSVSVLFFMLSKKSRWWMVLSVLFAALSTYTYFSVRFVLPVVFVVYFLLGIFPGYVRAHYPIKRVVKQFFLVLILPLMLYGLLLLPLFNSSHYKDANTYRLSTSSILSSDQHVLDSNELREAADNNVISKIIFHRDYLLLKKLAENYSDTLSLNYLFISGDPNLRHGTGTDGVFLFGFFPFFIVGMYALARRRKRVLLFLVAWWLIALLPASVPETTPHTLRSLNAYVAVSLIIGYGIWYFYNSSVGMLTYKKHPVLYGLLGAILFGVVVFSYLHLIQYYLVIYPKASSDFWFANTREEAIIVNQIRKDKPVYTVQVGDKYYLWLLAYSEFLGTQIADKNYQGYIIKSTPIYKNDIGMSDLPTAGNAIVVVREDSLAKEIKSLYKDKIIDEKTVINMMGQTTYIFDVN